MIDILKKGLEAYANCVLQTAGEKRDYNNNDLLNATLIFSDVLFNKVYDLIEIENIDSDTANVMAKECGAEIRAIIKKYTNIDMHDVAKSH